MKRLIYLLPFALAIAQAQATCHMGMISGTYAISQYGSMTVAAAVTGKAPITYTGGVVGVLSIGYGGAISGAASISGFGPVTDFEAAGTALINPDCTGTMTVKWRAKGASNLTLTEVDKFVYDQDGKTLMMIVMDLGPGVLPTYQGTYKKISPVPNTVSW